MSMELVTSIRSSSDMTAEGRNATYHAEEFLQRAVGRMHAVLDGTNAWQAREVLAKLETALMLVRTSRLAMLRSEQDTSDYIEALGGPPQGRWVAPPGRPHMAPPDHNGQYESWVQAQNDGPATIGLEFLFRGIFFDAARRAADGALILIDAKRHYKQFFDKNGKPHRWWSGVSRSGKPRGIETMVEEAKRQINAIPDDVRVEWWLDDHTMERNNDLDDHHLVRYLDGRLAG